MGRRTYYCDYCDRSFQDNIVSRKRHLDSASHQAAVRAHYDLFKDPLEALRSEAAKPMCQMWFRSGACTYGPRCKYKHTMIDLASLPPPVVQEESLPGPWVRVEKRRPLAKPKDEPAEPPAPTPAPAKRPATGPVPLWMIAAESGVLPSDLPPSMHPPPPGGWVLQGPPAEWG
eukprot:tig00020693_g13041.t1